MKEHNGEGNNMIDHSADTTKKAPMVSVIVAEAIETQTHNGKIYLYRGTSLLSRLIERFALSTKEQNNKKELTTEKNSLE